MPCQGVDTSGTVRRQRSEGRVARSPCRALHGMARLGKQADDWLGSNSTEFSAVLFPVAGIRRGYLVREHCRVE